VASRADPIARSLQAEAVGIMAITAAYALLEHAALHEGSVDIDLLQDLAVGVVEALAQQGRHEVLLKRAAVGVFAADPVAP